MKVKNVAVFLLTIILTSFFLRSVQAFKEEDLKNLQLEYQESLNQYNNSYREFSDTKEFYLSEKNKTNLENVLNKAKSAMELRNQVLINFFENLYFYLQNFTNFDSNNKTALMSQIIEFQETFQNNIEEIENITNYASFVDYNENYKSNISQAQQLSYNIFYTITIDKMKFSYQRLNSAVQKIRQNFNQKISNNLEKKELIKKVGQINNNLNNISINLNKLEEDYQNTSKENTYRSFELDSQQVLDSMSRTKENLENLVF
jgi:hypothetical protein